MLETLEQARRIPYVFWRVTTAMDFALVAVLVLALSCDVVILGLTFASPGVAMPDWIFAPFFALAIVANFASAFFGLTSGGMKNALSFGKLKHLPNWVRPLLVALGAGSAVAFGSAFNQLAAGQPGYNAATNQYYFDDHGLVTITDRAHYLGAVAVQTRTFISGAILFTSIALAFALAEARLRRDVTVPRVKDIPLPQTPVPRRCPPPFVGMLIAAVGLVLISVGAASVIDRIDGYANNAPMITVVGVHQHLDAGPWVVFVWCETPQIDAQYGCPTVLPSDVVIQEVTTGSVIPTSFDPSSDHISPRGLPAEGQLTFNVATTGTYFLRSVRPIPKGIFVAESPGAVARSLVPMIAITCVGLATLLFALISLVRRARWRLRLAPPAVLSLTLPRRAFAK